MCRNLGLLLINHPLNSAVTSALLMSLSGPHTSCLSPYFSCCVCRKSVNTVILLFTIAFGTIVSVGLGFYLSHYHRSTCSSLKKAASSRMTGESSEWWQCCLLPAPPPNKIGWWQRAPALAWGPAGSWPWADLFLSLSLISRTRSDL